MSRTKHFLIDALAVGTYLIVLGVLFGLPSRADFSSEGVVSSSRVVAIIAAYSVLVIAFVFFLRLRYWLVWSIVLIAAAVAGSGLDLPYRPFVYPGRISIANALLTLAAIAVFWCLERLAAFYSGTPKNGSGELDPFDSGDDDKFVTLGIGEPRQ